MSNFLNSINRKSFYLILIGFWIVLSYSYMIKTRVDVRAHDFIQHVEYTQIIVNENRLPKPMETWESYHPPLYYIINSLISAESIKGLNLHNEIHNDESAILKHCNAVRFLSILYGLFSLLIISLLLEEIFKYSGLNLLVLLLICSTPKFVFLFTTYNNDSLATFFCILTVYLSFRLFNNWNRKDAFLLVLITSLSLYTKYSTLFCMIAILSIVFLIRFIKKEKISTTEIKFLLVFLSSVIILLPWLVFHNYKYTNKLLPVRFQHKVMSTFNIDQLISNLSSIIPILNKTIKTKDTEWKDPWVYPSWENTQPHEYTKENDYPVFVFLTSLFGETDFSQNLVKIAWYIFFIRLLLIALIIRIGLKSKDILSVALMFIGISHLIHILYLSRIIAPIHGSFQDYRFLAWNLPAFAVLVKGMFDAKNDNFFKKNQNLFCFIVLSAIFLQSAFIMELSPTIIK